MSKQEKISSQLKSTGIPHTDDLSVFIPSEERRKKGPYALIECFEEIPCDPCFSACSFKAVKEFVNINDIPIIDLDKCTGCGLCVPECPGLAIFLLDESRGDGFATISLPYEFTPLPEKGQVVLALDRQGKVVGEATVVGVKKYSRKSNTSVVTILVPREEVFNIRHFKEKNHG